MAINKLDASFRSAGRGGRPGGANFNINKAINEARKVESDYTKAVGKGRGSIGSTKAINDIKKQQSELKTLATDVDKVVKESHKFLAKMGIVVKSLAEGAVKATQAVGKASIDAVSQYTSAIKEDINVNKKTFVSLMLARSSPLMGYFVSKVFEMDIWKRMFSGAKEKAGAFFSSIGGFLKRRKGGTPGMGGARYSKRKGGGGGAIDFEGVMSDLGSGAGPSERGELDEMKRAGGKATIHITANQVIINARQLERYGGAKTDIFEKFVQHFGEYTKTQTQKDWTMFGYNVTGEERRGFKLTSPGTWFSKRKRAQMAPRKMGFGKEFTTLLFHELFPMRRSFNDQVLLILYQLRDALASKESQKIGLLGGIRRAFEYAVAKSVLARTLMSTLKTIGKTFTTAFKWVWSPFKLIFFKKFGIKYKVPTPKKAQSPAQYNSVLLGMIYTGVMTQLDKVNFYLKQIGQAQGAEMKDPEKGGWTIWRKTGGRGLSWLVNKMGMSVLSREVSSFIPGTKASKERKSAQAKLGVAANVSPEVLTAQSLMKIQEDVSQIRHWSGITLEENREKTRWEKLKERLASLKEKGKEGAAGLFGKAADALKNIAGNVKEGLTAVLTNPAVLQATGQVAAVLGAGMVGYKVGGYINNWINEGIKKFTGENTLGEYLATLGEETRVKKGYEEAMKSTTDATVKRLMFEMTPAAWALMGNTDGMTPMDLRTTRLALRESGAIRKYGSKFYTADEYIKLGIKGKKGPEFFVNEAKKKGKELIAEYKPLYDETIEKIGEYGMPIYDYAQGKVVEGYNYVQEKIPFWHQKLRDVAQTSTGYAMAQEEKMRKLYEQISGGTMKGWEKFQKQMAGLSIAQITNTQNMAQQITNAVTEAGGKAYGWADDIIDGAVNPNNAP